MSGRPPFNKPSPRRSLTPGDLLAKSQWSQGVQQDPAATSAPAAEAAHGAQAVLEQFQGLLQQDTSLAGDDRDELGRAFEQALQDVASSQDQASSDVFDRSTWHDTVELLRQGGFVEQDEADHLIRTLNEALAPLQRRESQLAMEFSRRVESDGQEKALEWFREASKANAEAAAKSQSGVPSGHSADVSPLRSDTVNSRSRRLRGPPGAR